MAVDLSAVHLEHSGAGVQGETQFSPQASLGGLRAGSNPYRQAALTANMTSVHVALAAGAIDDTPAGGKSTSPAVNSAGYAGAANLRHWWRSAYDPFVLGRDFGVSRLDLSTARQGITYAADSVADQPGRFFQQRRSLSFTPNDGITNGGATTIGIGDNWTIECVVKPDVVTGNGTFLYIGITGTAVDSINQIRFERQSADLHIRIVDQTDANAQKERLFSGFFSAGTWVTITVRWNGVTETLSVFKNGEPIAPSSTPEDDAITMADPATRGVLVGGAFWSQINPTNGFDGPIHSVMLWDRALTDGEIEVVAGFGDGPAPRSNLSYLGRYVVFVTGLNAGQARRCTFHNLATGEMHFAQGFPSLGSSGDVFRVALEVDLWNDGPTGPECAAGNIDHRCLFFLQASGESLSGIRWYLKPLDPGPIDLEICIGHATKASGDAVGSIAVDTDEPPINDPLSGAASISTRPQLFVRPQTYAEAQGVPDSVNGASANEFTLSSGSRTALWIKRKIGAGARAYRQSTWLLVMEAATGNITPGPHIVAFPIASSPVGVPTQFQRAGLDRTPRTFGGARFVAEVHEPTSDAPIEGVPVSFEILEGPGSLSSGGPIDTGEDGFARVQYKAPESDSWAGHVLRLRASFPGGPALEVPELIEGGIVNPGSGAALRLAAQLAAHRPVEPLPPPVTRPVPPGASVDRPPLASSDERGHRLERDAWEPAPRLPQRGARRPQ